MSSTSSKRSILHVDGDAFFASCEIALDPKLRGRAVVTGQERGIASAMNYKAKALGITRAMPIFQIRRDFPQVVIVSSDYFIYRIFSERMCHIVRQHVPKVEEYSIDECFADLTGLSESTGLSDLEIATRIKNDLEMKLGMTFSIGVGPTKVLAKVASKRNKPSGLTVLVRSEIKDYLATLPIEKIWGIGTSTAIRLWKLGVKTGGDFIAKNEDWVREFFDKPQLEIWNELRGDLVYEISTVEEGEDSKDHQKSISKTGTFKPNTSNKDILLSELSRHVEQACDAARRSSLVSSSVSFFLKDKNFRYYRSEIKLPFPVNTPHDIVRSIRSRFDTIYDSSVLYRASGVTLHALTWENSRQKDLFNASAEENIFSIVYKEIDKVSRKFGSDSIFLASSFRALKSEGRGHKKRLNIPFMGEVR